MQIVEIFQSIDGEAIHAGRITNFIRLAECNLRCSYCDTVYGQRPDCGEDMPIYEILRNLNENIDAVTLTGGEPLLHKENAFALLKALLISDYQVSVETNGSVDLRDFIGKFPEATYIMDFKSPSSGMRSAMDFSNLRILRKKDVLKFVVGSAVDLADMVSILEDLRATHKEGECPSVFVSPIFGKIDPKDIVAFLLDHEINDVKMQLQMHKIIWEPSERGV